MFTKGKTPAPSKGDPEDQQAMKAMQDALTLHNHSMQSTASLLPASHIRTQQEVGRLIQSAIDSMTGDDDSEDANGTDADSASEQPPVKGKVEGAKAMFRKKG